jgi:predicted nucleotidyltransferase
MAGPTGPALRATLGFVKPTAVPEASLPDVEGALARALEELAGPHVSSAYLFGSHASERAHRESDVDVGILVSWKRDRGERFEERVRLAGALPGRLGGRLVDVVVLNDAPPHLGRRVVLDGRRVFCADPEADHAYRRDVQLRAADLEPFLRRTRRLKLEALAR